MSGLYRPVEVCKLLDTMEILDRSLNDSNFRKLMKIRNHRVHDFVANAIDLCEPMKVFVCSDKEEDISYIRKTAVARGEETELANPNHTVHFDGFYDQARDKERTVYLVPKSESLGDQLFQMDRQEGLDMVKRRLKGSMHNKKLVVRFFCLGPVDSPFSVPCVQITDSFYVAHSEDLLYRQGYEYFKKLPNDAEIFWMLHSSGKLVHATSIDWDKRGVAIDYKENTVYSVNTQYAGNTIGLKKLALRLAIRKADREDWLAEHMFLMAVHGPDERKTYFTGAFPSGCGKTSTSMVPGATIVGDDIAYLKTIDDEIRGVNVESGIFGIIRSVSQESDPIIWNVLHSDRPAIFSNVLVHDGVPYWLDDGRETPKRGVNHSGIWYEGKVDANGEEILPSHKNARYTIKLEGLPNLDDGLDKPNGVPIGGIIYGGRDPDTWVPVQQSFSWAHGVITMGASLESETTAATLGKSGVRKFQPFSNMDFVSIPLGDYIQNHLHFGEFVPKAPRIFAVNYFLKDDGGNYLNAKEDKRVWLQWMDLRIHKEADAIRTPTGYIPLYSDLKRLFETHLGKVYSEEDYETQFAVRVPELIAKIVRIREIYQDSVENVPDILYRLLDEQQERLEQARAKFGDIISPVQFL
ncbi:phosphoenolpyruvate carboxykinase (GTP) [Candidatus Thorarchaeota archaeon]|nr:MAG: phosphoenolpyruvate carboxykinase (GTP) [Candidatus Thorarchaeota archaeon]